MEQLFAHVHRSVNESTFNILRWVSNVFHILLKYVHTNVWFGPSCVGKGSPTFQRIYDMIANMPKCHSHLSSIYIFSPYNYTLIVQMYAVINSLPNNAAIRCMFINKYSTDSWLCHPCLKLHYQLSIMSSCRKTLSPGH